MLFYLLWLQGCTLDFDPRIKRDEFAEGPCWSVHLSDGIEDPTEIESLFQCLNQTNNFDSFQGVVDQLGAPTREESTIGAELVSLINRQADNDLNIWSGVSLFLAMLEHSEQIIEPMLELMVEMTYGTTMADLPLDLHSEDSLKSGILHHWLTLIPPVSTTILDSPPLREELIDIWNDDFEKLTCFTTNFIETNPTMLDDLMNEVGLTIHAVGDQSNNRWSEASDNSFLGLMEIMSSADNQLIEAFRADVQTILEDQRIHYETINILNGNQTTLGNVPSGLYYLATVDVNGGTVSGNEKSALYRILRLMDQANGELSCSVNIFGIPLTELQVENLAVELLDRISREDVDTVLDAVELVDILEGNLAQWMIEAIINSGNCTMLTATFIEDLEAMKRLGDPQARDLVSLGIDVLKSFRHPTEEKNRIPQLVNIFAQIHKQTISSPLIEILLDLKRTDLFEKLIPVIQMINDDTADCSVTIGGLLSGISEILDGQPSQLEVMQPLLQIMVNHHGFWSSLDTLGTLLQEEDTIVRKVPQLVLSLYEIEEISTLLSTMDTIVNDEQTLAHLLRIMESEIINQELLRTSSQSEGILPFGARLVTTGTVRQLLGIVNTIFNRLLDD